jgi:N-sulfoglucosamine sulfohydrolase
MKLRTLALWLASLSSLLEARADERPNIVMAFADDWGRYASAYAQLEPGGPADLVSTPNFDRIAADGILFTQAYVNAPSCTPCRSSLLSGQYFWRTGMGAILQGASWDDRIPSYPLELEKAGYKIGHTYKVWSPGTPADRPHGGKRTSYNSAGRKFNGFSQYVDESQDPLLARQELLDEVRGNFQSFLDDRGDDQPFCYWFGPTNCHRKWIQGSGKKHWGLDPDQLAGKLPAYLPDVEEVREDFCDYLGEAQAFDLGLGVILDNWLLADWNSIRSWWSVEITVFRAYLAESAICMTWGRAFHWRSNGRASRAADK